MKNDNKNNNKMNNCFDEIFSYLNNISYVVLYVNILFQYKYLLFFKLFSLFLSQCTCTEYIYIYVFYAENLNTRI